jgi:pyrroline-5-carboxylate reductase
MTKLLLVGGGRMGQALLGGLVTSGWAEIADLAVTEKVPGLRDELTARFPGLQVAAEPVEAEGAVLAVKPPDVPTACEALAATGTKRVLSIAAGITIATLEEHLGDGVAVVRSMPNTPALVGAGAAAIAPGTAATDADLDWAEGLLRAVGTVVRVPEKLLDAVTGLSGSGPAYVFLVVEALIEGGVLAGLPRDVATELAVHTLVGAGRLLAETGEPAEALRAQVTSPGGTTAAGLRALEAAGVRSAFLEAVAAATARSRELGGG